MDVRTYFAIMPSPLGRILLAGDAVGLRRLSLLDGERPLAPRIGWIESPDRLASAIDQLREYFSGFRIEFDLRLAPRGTSFQQAVWRAVQSIPYGQTTSYARLARRVGTSKAARAVGAANGRNPLPIVIPCHRIVGSNGNLTGYGAGIAVKRRLLEWERRIHQARSRAEWLRQIGTDRL